MAFSKRVEEDEIQFKPIGKQIGQYAKKLITAPATNKGKGKATSDSDKVWESCAMSDEGAVVYEAWMVRE